MALANVFNLRAKTKDELTALHKKLLFQANSKSISKQQRDNFISSAYKVMQELSVF